jgi:hypothetical protein
MFLAISQPSFPFHKPSLSVGMKVGENWRFEIPSSSRVIFFDLPV